MVSLICSGVQASLPFSNVGASPAAITCPGKLGDAIIFTALSQKEKCRGGAPNLSVARRERGNQIFGANLAEAVKTLTVTARRGASGSEPVS